MCGIVGYAGKNDGAPILLGGLRRLEYRGYDSSGIAMVGAGKTIELVRSCGKIASLDEKLRDTPVSGHIGIAHTRWATHGRPSDENAHPHRSGPFVVVHNGIIENYAEVKAELQAQGHKFDSETDTEVIVALVDREWRSGKTFKESVTAALGRLRGSYAVLLLSEAYPDELIAVRKESPLILALGNDGCYFASDAPAILAYTNRVIYLEDGDLVHVKNGEYVVEDLHGNILHRVEQVVDWNPIMAEKAGYKHFMLKEIHEQPQSVINTFRGALDNKRRAVELPEINLSHDDIRRFKKMFLVACGTSYHACLVGKYMIEALCGIPVEVDLGSEFRYRGPILDEDTLMIVVSQSGETADTRAALVEGMERGATCRAVVNVVGSSLARMAGGVVYTHAGPEIGVASTKAFTAQLIALYLFTLYCAEALGSISEQTLQQAVQDLVELPGKIESLLASSLRSVEGWAKQTMQATDFLYLGRGILYPVALEGALKLKEISYIHAEGYAAGEMKHGPIALIDETLPVMNLLQDGPLLEKMLSNVQEVRARGGRVLALVEESAQEKLASDIPRIVIPNTSPWLAPVLFTIPLQLLAYTIAVLRGTDVDQPRNLAKSVTVE